MIDVDALNVRFGHGTRGVHAVKDVSFKVNKGESFGLVGESGSGKSTVLRAITGLLDHVAHINGRMTVAGENLGHKRSRQFRRLVQMVFQDPYGSLHPRHTVYQILSEPAHIHGMDDIESRALRSLEEVGLDASFRFRYPHRCTWELCLSPRRRARQSAHLRKLLPIPVNSAINPDLHSLQPAPLSVQFPTRPE